jgi:hypothetical protein
MRITNKILENRIDYLNELTNNPKTPRTQTNGKLVSNVGNYHLDGAYGGYELAQMHNSGGGVDNPLRSGHIPKKELYNLINAFISGIESVKYNQKGIL